MKKLILLVLGYVYVPLVYFAVYLPFIVPGLHQWKHIPHWVVGLGIIGLVAIAMIIGATRSHISIVIHSLGIALFFVVFGIAMSKFQMPGFLKIEGGLLWSMLRILISAIIIMTFAELGYFLKELESKRIKNR